MHPKSSASLRGLRICLGYHPFLLFGLNPRSSFSAAGLVPVPSSYYLGLDATA